jgi:hypothetical protein
MYRSYKNCYFASIKLPTRLQLLRFIEDRNWLLDVYEVIFYNNRLYYKAIFLIASIAKIYHFSR